jgi:hypothetical protein
VKRFSLAVALVVVLSTLVAAAEPRLSVDQVVRIANSEAKRRGWDLRKFGRPEPHYNYTQRDDTWAVFYEGKPHNGFGEVGNHFTVYVVDKTKEVWLIPGR